jgi:hypothetical protein
LTTLELAAVFATAAVLILCAAAIGSVYLFGHREQLRTDIETGGQP